MSPQFVDFDADGQLDIVAGIYDGSPHLVRGSKRGWLEPEQILDRDGARIVFNQFWNFDVKKWETTTRSDADRAAGGKPPGIGEGGHLTSAIAFDHDGDGDLDLLLGDHHSGRVFRRTNEGSAAQPKFATVNEPVLADGRPIDVPGTVATLRLVDWNGDGRLDLACGSMGDPWGKDPGGGVVLFANTGTAKSTSFGPPIVLLERSQKGTVEPQRPDSGIYMDFADHDGDGDLDMVVGGYSHWTPPQKVLTAAEQERVVTLRATIAAAQKEQEEIWQAIDKALEGLDEASADARRAELMEARKADLAAIAKKRQPAEKDLGTLVPGDRRESWVWLYENLGPRR